MSGTDFYRSAIISIHALLAESDRSFGGADCSEYLFLSTLSLRRATRSSRLRQTRNIISIHALLAESDHDTYVIMEATKVISIHALLAESDTVTARIIDPTYRFLSTLSLRRATAAMQTPPY